MARLSTGSDGYEQMNNRGRKWDSETNIQMFRIKGLYPSIIHKNTVNFFCNILPAFDKNTSPLDNAYKESVMPYRDRDSQGQNGAYKFSGWFTPVLGYTYYGKGGSTFVSPKTVGLPDPIDEITSMIYDSKKAVGDTTYLYLTENTFNTDQSPVALRRPKRLALMNVWAPNTNVRSKDQDTKNRVLLLGQVAFGKLTMDLNQTGTTDNPDPEWPNYVYGDPTNPDHSIVCTPTLYKSPDNPNLAACHALDLGTVSFRGDLLHKEVRYSKITPGMLRGRYDLADTDNVINIPSYDEIVELLVAEGLVPYELVERMCYDKCSHFPKKPASTISTPTPAPRPQSTVAPSVAPQPRPVVQPAPVGSDDLEDDQIPGIGPDDSPFTEEDAKRLEALQALVRSGAGEQKDFVELSQLVGKQKKQTKTN